MLHYQWQLIQVFDAHDTTAPSNISNPYNEVLITYVIPTAMVGGASAV